MPRGWPAKERDAGPKHVAQGDSSGAATSRSKSSAAKGRRKAGPKRKLDLSAPRVGGVQKCKGKAKAKRSAGSPASKPQPEPEEVEILKLEWPVEGNLLADNTPPSPQPSTRHRKRSLAPRVDTLAAKRPRAAPSVAQQEQAEALKQLRGDLREAELKIDGLAAKSAQQEQLLARLEQFIIQRRC